MPRCSFTAKTSYFAPNGPTAKIAIPLDEIEPRSPRWPARVLDHLSRSCVQRHPAATSCVVLGRDRANIPHHCLDRIAVLSNQREEMFNEVSSLDECCYPIQRGIRIGRAWRG